MTWTKLASGVGTPEASAPPAGWYPDPEGGQGERFWDGTAWTDQRR
jgi:Protein of unknown function (DUF2510)